MYFLERCSLHIFSYTRTERRLSSILNIRDSNVLFALSEHIQGTPSSGRLPHVSSPKLLNGFRLNLVLGGSTSVYPKVSGLSR
jgi:hypothetical protein